MRACGPGRSSVSRRGFLSVAELSRVPDSPTAPSPFHHARRGYDTYTPHRSVVYHDYTHGATEKDANAWSRKYRELKHSHERLRTLLGYSGAVVGRETPAAAEMLGRWDLGKKRSLNQLIAFTGADTRETKVDFNSCGKLQWVPFDEGDDDDWYSESTSAARRRRSAKAESARVASRLFGKGARGEGEQGSGRGGEGSRQARAWAGGGVHGLSEQLAIPRVSRAHLLWALSILIIAAVASLLAAYRRERGRGGTRMGRSFWPEFVMGKAVKRV